MIAPGLMGVDRRDLDIAVRYMLQLACSLSFSASFSLVLRTPQSYRRATNRWQLPCSAI